MSLSPSVARGGLSSRLSPPSRKVYCDLDGVLVDFNKGCVAVMGTTPDQLTLKNMWRGLANARSFYEHLDWMSDGQELWYGIVDLHPTILTGLPMGGWAERQKRKWCARELGKDVPVITCMTRDKHLYCRTAGSILIDDRISSKAAWQRAGGVFIHHTSTASSLEELRALLDPPPVPADSDSPQQPAPEADDANARKKARHDTSTVSSLEEPKATSNPPPLADGKES